MRQAPPNSDYNLINSLGVNLLAVAHMFGFPSSNLYETVSKHSSRRSHLDRIPKDFSVQKSTLQWKPFDCKQVLCFRGFSEAQSEGYPDPQIPSSHLLFSQFQAISISTDRKDGPWPHSPIWVGIQSVCIQQSPPLVLVMRFDSPRAPPVRRNAPERCHFLEHHDLWVCWVGTFHRCVPFLS